MSVCMRWWAVLGYNGDMRIPFIFTSRRLLLLLAALTLLTAACGDSDDPPSPEELVDEILESDDPAAAAEDLADDLVETLEDRQAAAGGGGFTITVGDQSWTFDSVLCAFGEDQIGQEGAEFVLSSIQDGLQAYVSIDSFGPSVSVDDISDFQNPSVSLSNFGDATIDIDGKDISGSATFFDNTTDDLSRVEGTFSGTCP